MNDISRRNVLKNAAWAAPVVAMAVAAPLASASADPCPSQTYIYDPRTTTLKKGKNDSAKVTVVTGVAVIVEYIKDIGHPHVNIRINGVTTNHHFPRNVKAGQTFTFPLDKCVDPEWIQTAGNNVYYYGGGVFS